MFKFRICSIQPLLSCWKYPFSNKSSIFIRKSVLNWLSFLLPWVGEYKLCRCGKGTAAVKQNAPVCIEKSPPADAGRLGITKRTLYLAHGKAAAAVRFRNVFHPIRHKRTRPTLSVRLQKLLFSHQIRLSYHFFTVCTFLLHVVSITFYRLACKVYFNFLSVPLLFFFPSFHKTGFHGAYKWKVKRPLIKDFADCKTAAGYSSLLAQRSRLYSRAMLILFFFVISCGVTPSG